MTILVALTIKYPWENSHVFLIMSKNHPKNTVPFEVFAKKGSDKSPYLKYEKILTMAEMILRPSRNIKMYPKYIKHFPVLDVDVLFSLKRSTSSFSEPIFTPEVFNSV